MPLSNLDRTSLKFIRDTISGHTGGDLKFVVHLLNTILEQPIIENRPFSKRPETEVTSATQ